MTIHLFALGNRAKIATAAIAALTLAMLITTTPSTARATSTPRSARALLAQGTGMRTAASGARAGGGRGASALGRCGGRSSAGGTMSALPASTDASDR